MSVRRLRLSRGLSRDERGVAAVEAALVLPVLLLLTFGAVDVSWLMAQSHRVEQGLAAGGGYLAKSPDPVRDAGRARNLAATGSFSGGEPRVAGWGAEGVRVSFRSESGDFRTGSRGRVAVLEATVPYRGFGILSSIRREPLVIRATHEERVDL